MYRMATSAPQLQAYECRGHVRASTLLRERANCGDGLAFPKLDNLHNFLPRLRALLQDTGLLLILTASVLTFLTACTSPPTSGPDTTTTATPPPHSKSDQQAAERALPTQEDLGPMYSSTPYVPARAPAEDAILNDCLGIPPTAAHETARAYSTLFATGANERIQLGITFVDTETQAQEDVAAYAHDRAGDCLKNSFLRQFDAAGRQGTVTQARIVPAPGGDGVIAYRLTVEQSGTPLPAPRVIDLVFAVRGRAEVAATFINLSEPVRAEQQDRLIRLCLARLDGKS